MNDAYDKGKAGAISRFLSFLLPVSREATIPDYLPAVGDAKQTGVPA